MIRLSVGHALGDAGAAVLRSRRSRFGRHARFTPEIPPMSSSGLPHDVVYPRSDGQPMAETDIHATCMMYVTYALKGWLKRRARTDVYVASNNFLYFERGNPRAVVSPDVYVVMRVPAHLRDTYLLWNEPKGPDFVLEVTSASTRREDRRRKRDAGSSPPGARRRRAGFGGAEVLNAIARSDRRIVAQCPQEIT